MAHVHEYPNVFEWTGGRDGSGQLTSLRSNTTNTLAVPPEFQGTGSGTNPEELLTNAITGCYTITFSIIAGNRKLPVVGLKTEATGFVEQNGAQFTYKNVVIRPTITLAADATDEQVAMATDMAHKADMYCIVTNAVRDKVEVTIEPNVVRA
jgi:peroxiredoxin-like protein